VHSTKADLYRRLGRIPEALEADGLEAYGKALEESIGAGKTFSAAAHLGIKKILCFRLSIWARLKRL
jgi:uncharacterized ferritin-like protein (DUF455 family)